MDVAGGVAQFGGHRRTLFVENITKNDSGAFADQKPGMGGTHPAGGPGDQGDLAVNASHGRTVPGWPPRPALLPR
ncbi:hypothetical protein GCM10010533_04880 [Mycolicibacterium pallens]